MFTVVGQGPYRAVSYDSATFADLSFYMSELGLEVRRLDPDEFLSSTPDDTYQYINLVTKFPLRQQISEHLDRCSLERFSFFASYIPNTENKKLGSFIYTNVSIYPSAEIDRDVIVHSNSAVAHKAHVGQGCFISGSVIVCGGTDIGKYCWLGAGTIVIDNLRIADGTSTVARSLIINDILTPGTNYKKHTNF
jgi:NDP-sugar pyrophosphorylase family protein